MTETQNNRTNEIIDELMALLTKLQYELPVKYIYPNYFTLVEKSINTVNVVIEKKVVEPVEEKTENKSEKTETEEAFEGLRS